MDSRKLKRPSHNMVQNSLSFCYSVTRTSSQRFVLMYMGDRRVQTVHWQLSVSVLKLLCLNHEWPSKGEKNEFMFLAIINQIETYKKEQIEQT